MLDDFKKTYPVIIELPVQWGDMDAFNHVNNVVYFRYFENARIAYFERTPVFEQMKQTGVGPVVGQTECRYRRPLTYPDNILVGARTLSIQEFGFVHEYAVFSERQQTITTDGKARIVLFNGKNGQKAAVDEVMRQSLVELEGRPLSDEE
ncbi:thioesterase [Saccharospirillum sp. MSK14-1]|uniref:acyl-CoA thioesterase n=1 Tax=Saccharospirillum sp. MSK14-1 TaxID=1897632 RepID=UPI000D3A9D8F|nr:acyl-CoA thioesterase [Saccharospirillum sp. MSK14-1]PTY35984.1 thioesterase [Saccharospirillum sp. MSK14-1]